MQQRFRNLQLIASSQSVSSAERDSLSWSDVRGFISRYGRIIAAVGIASILVGWAYAASNTPSFVARTLILIESRLPQSLREQLGEATLVLDSPAIESQIAILKSRSIAASVITKLGFTPQQNPLISDQPGRLARILAVFGSGVREPAERDTELAMNRLIEKFQDHLEVRRNGLSYVLELGFHSTDATLAATIVNAIADVYLADQINQKVDAVRQASEWRDEQIVKIRNLMNKSSRAVQEYKARRDYRILPSESVHPPETKGGAAAAPEAETREPTTLEELEVTAQAYRKVYESNLQVHADLVQRQFLQFTNARIISRAAVPVSPEFPRTRLIVVLTGIGGLLVAAGASLVHAAVDDKVSSRRDIEATTGLACLSEIAPAGRATPRSWREMFAAAGPPDLKNISYIDIARLQAAIEQKFERGARRTIVIAPATGMRIAALVAARLAEHYRSTGEPTLLIADPAAAQSLGLTTGESASLMPSPPHATSTDVMTVPKASPDERVWGADSSVEPMLKPYKTLVYLLAPSGGAIALRSLLRETPVHIIVADRNVSSATEIRAVASILSANANQPPHVVLSGGQPA